MTGGASIVTTDRQIESNAHQQSVEFYRQQKLEAFVEFLTAASEASPKIVSYQNEVVTASNLTDSEFDRVREDCYAAMLRLSDSHNKVRIVASDEETLGAAKSIVELYGQHVSVADKVWSSSVWGGMTAEARYSSGIAKDGLKDARPLLERFVDAAKADITATM